MRQPCELHDMLRCTWCDNRVKDRKERVKRAERAGRVRNVKPAVSYAVRVASIEAGLMNEYLNGVRCWSCDGRKYDRGLCECRRAEMVRSTAQEAVMFAGMNAGVAAARKAAASTISTRTWELGASSHPGKVAGLTEADDLRQIVRTLGR